MYARNVDGKTLDWLTAMSGRTGVPVARLVDALLGEARRQGWHAKPNQATVIEVSGPGDSDG